MRLELRLLEEISSGAGSRNSRKTDFAYDLLEGKANEMVLSTYLLVFFRRKLLIECPILAILDAPATVEKLRSRV